MRSLPVLLQNALDGESFELVRLIKIRRRMDGGGGGVRYAESQYTIKIDESGDGQHAYFTSRGLKISSIPLALDQPETTVTFEIAVFSDEESPRNLDYVELLTGRYDNGEVTIYAALQSGDTVPYSEDDPTPTIEDSPFIELWRGFLGQCEISDMGVARFTCFNLFGKGREVPIEHCEPMCRVDFGSTRCGVSVPTVDTTVSSASQFNVVVGTSPGSDYRLGLIVPTTGDSVGEAFEIREVSGTTLKTYVPMTGKLSAGDAVTIHAGCDKTLVGPQGCQFWDNVVNFQGEPHVPTSDTTDIHYETWGG